jgi:hypothetical protein
MNCCYAPVRLTTFARGQAHRPYARRMALDTPLAPYVLIGGRVWGNRREVLIFISVARTERQWLVDSRSCGEELQGLKPLRLPLGYVAPKGATHKEFSAASGTEDLLADSGRCCQEILGAQQAPALHIIAARLRLECGGLPPLSRAL